MTNPFHIIEPNRKKVPIIISVPHCGVDFPTEIKTKYNSDLIQKPDDTDWFVHQLYNFATELGITIIHAKYSRWVIDLNRDPESAPLYNDGRIITGLTPTTDFFGNSIYKENQTPSETDIKERLSNYYWPYYQKIESLIAELQAEYKNVILWDAHSIRQFVPTIRKENFPDMILGNNDETTSDKSLISTALENLNNGSHTVNHNTPFKGGHITRYFGNPSGGIHTLQLEMVKKLYMDDEEINFSEARANKIREILIPTFTSLIQQLDKLNNEAL